ncbi:phospholipid-transporting ATPase ABCA3-like [Cydia splendana]|uniref:phospholipid-transporting ATPase ABCA3-like n=1 Tax=Cydia splendana TaxID=1100963 RepID=UPI00300D9AD5
MWSVWVLLWKHSLMRKRRYIRTFFDYFSPLLYFVLIHLTTGPSLLGRHENVHYTEPFSLEKYGQHRVRVLFTPDTDHTNRLMDEVGAKLKLKRLDHLPGSKEYGFFPFSNASALSILEYSKDMSQEDAIIIFEDMESEMWPNKLNYTIRMKNNFRTNQYEPEDPFDMGHHEYFGIQYEEFMRLQWAIDTSYLHLLTGANIDQNMELQEFPFAAAHFNTNVVAVSQLSAFLLPFALTLTFVFLTGRLFEEKNSGMHELVKMVGVSWEELGVSHVLDLVPHLLLYAVGGALFYKIDDLIPVTCGFYIALAMALHFLTVVALAFVTVYVFNMTQYLELITMSVYTAFLVASMLTQKLKSRALSLLCCLLPHDPFIRFWRALGSREMFGGSISITNMWTRNAAEQTAVAELYLFMVLQIILLSMIAWYLSRVRPGKYGQALPWNFPFCKDYWYMQPKVEAAPEETQFDPCEADPRYFEKAPAGLPVGIQVNDVYKSFGKDPALSGVDLTVYRGEITVLLGHNGAGKTTLINIITGLISASSGRVLVEGKDTVKQAKEVRKLIGLCPQENIFFPHLTVLEHAMFFAMLKGKSYTQAHTSATDLFSKLQLSNKANALTCALSGGMKRRAQLACAVAGGAQVLVLDEPTSGLDVETRRELWDLLLSLRGERTLLLTTHFMEEADALGDRIAALHHGRVRCHATSMFLKRAIGTGYRLSFTTIGAPKEAAITSTITTVVPTATIRDRRPNGVSYNLPAKDTARFPELFASLEDARSKLQIDTIGVGKSTLDEVFLELCSDDKPAYTEEPDNTTTEPVHGTVKGPMLYARQFAVLLLRQWRYITSHLLSFLGIIVFVTLLLWAFTSVANNHPFGMQQTEKPDADMPMSLELYSARAQRRVLVNVDKDTLDTLRVGFKGVQFEEVQDAVDAIIQIGKEDIAEYNKYLVGIEINDTNIKALYTTTVRHAAPVALNLLSNALSTRLVAGADAHAITMRNHPLRGAFVPFQDKIKFPKQNEQKFIWTCNIAMVVLFYLCTFSKLPCSERVSGARHAHVVAGAPRALHWAATLAAQLLQALLACVLPVCVLAAAVDKDGTFDQPGFVWALCVLLILGILAFLGLVYLASTLLSYTATSTVLVVIAFLFSQITPNIPESTSFWYKLLSVPYALLAPHTLTAGLAQVATVAQTNAYCNLNRDRCPALAGPDNFETAKCCGNFWYKLLSVPYALLAPHTLTAGLAQVATVAQTNAYCNLNRDRCPALDRHQITPNIPESTSFWYKLLSVPYALLAPHTLTAGLAQVATVAQTNAYCNLNRDRCPALDRHQITPNIPESTSFWYKLLSVPYALLAPHTLTAGLAQVASVAQTNAYCYLNRARCPALAGPDNFERAKCCDSPPGSEPWSYFAMEDAAGWPMLILALQAVAYFVLTLLSDSGFLERVYARVVARGARPPRRLGDAMARAETAYVEKAIQLPKQQITDSILCHNVQKLYPGCCKRKPFFAVKGVSFSVKKGECFGLLGVNGAGKTTTFKMLTGLTSPTGGEIFANGHYATDRNAYMRTFSYCPQFAGLDDFLTGRQNLSLLLTLRGLQEEDVSTVSNSWIEEVDLSRHADKRVSSYSGGCARRLAAAAALCQAVRTALLDEPTAGVDPLARRRMHQALLRARKHHELIIASHSLDEMEALCHRIAIMSGGELRALGSAAALKAEHAQGYSVVFKLTHAQDVTDGVSKLDEFKGELNTRFSCELQDQHQSMLSYHVKDSLRYSELFSQLEHLREQFPSIVEDYTVTETTLEEVFLALAKEARAETYKRRVNGSMPEVCATIYPLRPKQQITDSILCHNVQKLYPGCCKRKPFFAVKGVSFSVKKGECFGLLGVNGAGKTTTFKMLTGLTSPTGGEIFANGHYATDRNAYMRTFSYCPQFAGLDDFLTGRQNLSLLLTLRGLQEEDVSTVSNSWIEEVDLSRHADKRVSSYSGGCARRLAAAAALCQAVRTALLDEPTAGVDPLARRRMHQALLRARKHHELIIASHSLDEMEALCHRIAIMSGGELRALGSAAALKAEHAQGYSVVFKLTHAQDVTDGVSKLDEFKGELNTRFSCELQDQHQSMLSYHVKDSLRYSELFSQLEHLREQFPSIVEDYTVTETTLEEVFLALAKEARAETV